MKRLAAVVSAMGLGLLAAWLFGYVTSQINWPHPKGLAHGCYEIDHCDVPWWITVIFVAWFFGPAFVYGGVAFVGTDRKWSSTRWAATFCILLLVTGCLYFSWYAYQYRLLA